MASPIGGHDEDKATPGLKARGSGAGGAFPIAQFSSQ